jgi:putative MATE family efflux protein
MGNTVIRAEGKPKFAMYAMMIPSVGNLVLDYIFIKLFDFGMRGAAWATTGSYMLCLSFIIWYFLSQNSELKITKCQYKLDFPIIKEIGSLGFVTLARQAIVSITYLLMNNILFNLGGETSVTAYAIVGRMLMFALFPVYGITQGFLPIAGFNYGAEKYRRVRDSILTAIKYGIALAGIIFIFLMLFPDAITRLFTQDAEVLKETPPAMRWVFAATPIIGIQLIGAAYFQAIGKAMPALLLTLLRQGIFFIPLIFILPNFYGELGVWMSFPISDVLATVVTAYFLHREVKLNLLTKEIE